MFKKAAVLEKVTRSAFPRVQQQIARIRTGRSRSPLKGFSTLLDRILDLTLFILISRFLVGQIKVLVKFLGKTWFNMF